MSRQFSKEPQDLVLYPQDTAAFYCDIDAAPAPVFRWYKDDVEVTSDDPRYIFHDDARMLELTNVGSRDFGNYRCIASNSPERAASSRTATLQQQTDMSKKMIIWCCSWREKFLFICQCKLTWVITDAHRRLPGSGAIICRKAREQGGSWGLYGCVCLCG